MQAKGKYIVLEGAGGVGKSSQLQELAARMRAIGIVTRVLSDPDSEADLAAEAIGEIIKNPSYGATASSKLLLASAARNQLLETIEGELARGVNCLVEGSYLSTLVKHFYGNGDAADYYSVNAVASFTSGLEPDLLVVLDAPVTRLKSASNENADDAYLERVRAGYLWEAHQRGYPVIYASQTFEEVAEQIWRLASAPTPTSRPRENSNYPETKSSEAVTTKPSVIKIKGASALLASKLAATSEVINQLNSDFYASHDSHRHYKYFTPPSLTGQSLKQYRSVLDQIFETYSKLAASLEKSITAHDRTNGTKTRQQQNTTNTSAHVTAALVLPLAMRADISIDTDARLAPLATSLLASELPEAKSAGQQILDQARQLSTDLSQTSADASQSLKTAKNLRKLAENYLPPSHTDSDGATAKLVNHSPRNELDTVADILYPHSDESVEELNRLASGWSYAKKAKILKSALGQNPQLASDLLSNYRYSLDVVCDWLALAELQRQLPLATSEFQALTPRYGYEVPKLIEDANLTDDYQRCFDLSLKLYSQLQAAGFGPEAQYATLAGHRLRFRLNLTAAQILQLSNINSIYSGAQKLVDQIRELVTEVHPLLAEALKSDETTSQLDK